MKNPLLLVEITFFRSNFGENSPIKKTLHRSQQNLATVNQHHPWLAMELEPNRKLFPDHLPSIRQSILHGALVGAGSTWPQNLGKCFFISFLKK